MSDDISPISQGPMRNIECAVTHNIECAHKAKGGSPHSLKIHGHSYLVETWFEAGPDMDIMRVSVAQIIALVDHTMLEDSVGNPTMEGLAKWLLERVTLIGTSDVVVTRIVIRRPTLGYLVEIRA